VFQTLSLDLRVAYNQLLFWVNKIQGAYYPPQVLDEKVDFGQLSYYKNCFIKYGTGQRLDDALAPFKTQVAFTTSSTGVLTSPDDYMDLIDIIPIVGTTRVTCPVLNEDEVTGRLNSQLIPVTVNRPFAEEITDWNYQLYPQVQQSGLLSYFRRPAKPVFKYTVISGRVIVYDQAGSTQLEWGDDEIQSLLIFTLKSIGINLSDQEILQFAELTGQQNLLSTLKV
jgi:hypothetical protein